MRAIRRVAALISVDGMCFLVARSITRYLTDGTADVAAGIVGPSSLGVEANELALAAALFVGTTISGAYGPGDAHRQFGRLFIAATLASALPLWSQLWVEPALSAVRLWFVFFGPLFIMLVLLRTLFDALARRLSHSAAGGALARTVVVGAARDWLPRMDCAALARRAGFDVLGFVDIAATPHHGALGSVMDIERILFDREADTVVLCGFPNADTMSRVLRAAAVAECTVLASAPQLELPAVRPNVIKQGGQPLLELRPVALRVEQLIIKRTMDIVGGTILLVLTAPVFVLVSVLVALDSAGPVLFAQRRLGRYGRPIRCYKFRSMYVDAEARLLADPELLRRYIAHDYKLPASIDNRITRVGRLLRRTSLDELPQLWNVIKGDMSLVGPRPIVPDEIHHYNGEGPLLLSLKPGMTGAWQVSGRSSLPYPGRAAVELEYVERWTLWSDLRILLRTLPAVVAARGAH